MTTIQRIEKLITEYRAKVKDCDEVLENTRGWSDRKIAGQTRREWNPRRQAYVTMIADLESILDLGDPIGKEQQP